MHFVRSCPATSERAQGGPMEVEKDAVNRYSSTLLQSFVMVVAKNCEDLLGVTSDGSPDWGRNPSNPHLENLATVDE